MAEGGVRIDRGACWIVPIPTEPIGSIPRPRSLIQAAQGFESGRVSQAELHSHYDSAVRDTIARLLRHYETLLGQVTANPRHDLPIVCIGVFLGAFAWITALTSSLHLLRRRLLVGRGVAAWMRLADIAGGLLLPVRNRRTRIRRRRQIRGQR